MHEATSSITLTSAGAVESYAHGLSAVPSLVLVSPLYAAADILSATTGITVGESAASAATSAVVYLVANKNAVKCRVFVLI